jgi:hypothetical protein
VTLTKTGLSAVRTFSPLGVKIQNFHEFHDIYRGLQMLSKRNHRLSSSRRPNKPSPVMVLQCKFEINDMLNL